MDPVLECRALDDPTPSGPALARTYGGDRDPWDRALEHHRVAEYAAENPDAGSHAVARALELPRGRIRLWVDGDGAPDPAHGLQTALDRGWLVERDDQQTRLALAVAVTWVAAGGSIEQMRNVPLFSAQTPDERSRLERTADLLDIDLMWIDRDDRGKGVEAKPSNDASVFGRVLVAAGAPTAPDAPLPAWILDGNEALRRAAAACYAECRGQIAGNGQNLQIHEQTASDERLESIGTLLGSVAEAGSWTVSAQHVRLDREATVALLGEIDVEV